MAFAAIPSWNAMGVMPPVNSVNPVDVDRSPYEVSLSDIMFRFGTSPDRCRILNGFLEYRRRLHLAGLDKGFQWLDGSFLEQIEKLEVRSPNDIDVVTFFVMPAGLSQLQLAAAHPDLFPRTQTEHIAFKKAFFVDQYMVNLASPSERLIRSSVYWYSMWSHRRDLSWKGFLQVDLDGSEDVSAAAFLASLQPLGETP
jgi:hypothetical protein